MAEQQKADSFGPEISQILDVMFSSPSINKDIFLPELIRDASRGLKTIRIESLIEEWRLHAEPNLFIKIVPDKKSKTLSIIDTGIGMTRDELVELGTMSEGLEMDMYKRIMHGYLNSNDPLYLQKRALIDAEKIGATGGVPTPHMPENGCFGFYSAYLVAEKVVVTTKNNEVEVQYVWESQLRKGDVGSYTVTEDDTSSNKLTRGTKVTLFLKEDHLEYLEEHKLKEIVDRYCRFCRYPIYVLGENKTDASAEDKHQINVDDDKKTDASAEDKHQINVDDDKKTDASAEDKHQINVDDDKKKHGFECLRNIMKDILAYRVKDVVVSDRFNDLDFFMTVDMVLNINPDSPVIEDMRKKADANRDDKSVFAKVHMIYDRCYTDIIWFDMKYKTSYYKPVGIDMPSLWPALYQ